MSTPWMTDRPTHPGWYLLKYQRGLTEPPLMDYTFCRVERDDETQLLVVRLECECAECDGVVDPLDEYVQGFWKGPLDLEAL
jgi:hypothetical protein